MDTRARFAASAATAALAVSLASGTAGAQVPPATTGHGAAPIAVVVDGRPLVLDQPPVEVAGRVFVPLRGIFERLGASVVFQNDQINATAGQRTIGLHIGAPTAYVDGRAETLESPPFLVGGRALVPLRFVAETLGARVAFEPSGPYGRAVIIARSGIGDAPVAVIPATERPAPTYAEPPPAAAPVSHQYLIRVEPPFDGTIPALRPEISATFATAVDPESVKIAIDGRDVTSEAYVNDRSFVYHPTFDLPRGPHVVHVAGRASTQSVRFDERWSFTVIEGGAQNFFRDVLPEEQSHVGTSFDVRGFTTPGARVHVIATASSRAIGFGETNEDQTVADGIANEDGYFRIHVDVADHGSGVVDVRLVSTATDGTSTVETLRLRP